MPFTRMDEGKIEDWMVIRQSVSERQSTMPQIIKNLLLRLEEQVDGFAVNQLEHSLQTATRAVRAGASEELIVAALCHDIETDALAFGQSAHAGLLHRAHVHKYVLFAVFRLDESKSLDAIEKLNGAYCHT